MTYPRNTDAPLEAPSFFTGLTIDRAAIKEHAGYIRTYADLIASAIESNDKSVSALKAAVEASDKAAVEMQRRIDRLRGGLSVIDKKIAVYQARRPRA